VPSAPVTLTLNPKKVVAVPGNVVHLRVSGTDAQQQPVQLHWASGLPVCYRRNSLPVRIAT